MPREDARQEPSSTDRRYEAFLQHFTRVQGPLMAYVRSLVHDPAGADDVFQATSLTLWRRFDAFRAGEPFLPWALGIARHEEVWRAFNLDQTSGSRQLQ